MAAVGQLIRFLKIPTESDIMFMTERELNRLADLIVERLEKRGLCIAAPRNGQALVVEDVDINTLPVSLRGAQG